MPNSAPHCRMLCCAALRCLVLRCRYVPMFGDLDYDPSYAYQAGDCLLPVATRSLGRC